MLKILLFKNNIRATFWFRYVLGNVPSALEVNQYKRILEIDGVKYRFCSCVDYEKLIGPQPKDTVYYWDMDIKFDRNFEEALKEISE